MIMENADADTSFEKSISIPLQRKRRSASPTMQGVSPCQWQWRTTDEPDEAPRFLTEAHCPNCKYFCDPIKYTIKVLVRDGCESSLPIWRWKEREITVGYVYRGSR